MLVDGIILFSMMDCVYYYYWFIIITWNNTRERDGNNFIHATPQFTEPEKPATNEWGWGGRRRR